VTDRSDDSTWRRASSRYAWLVVLLAAWLLAGLALIGRADNEGLLADVAVSPYHVPAYAALIVLLGYVLITIDRGRLRHSSWRRSFPRHYDGLVFGGACAVAWIVADLLWREAFGIRPGVEGTLAPTRLLIPIALALVASGPVRDALAGPSDGLADPSDVPVGPAGTPDASEEARLGPTGASRATPPMAPAVIATGLVAIAIGGLFGVFNPVSHSLGARTGIPPQDLSEIWVMDADGSRQTRLLPAPGAGIDYSWPAWSPDGSRLAYTQWRNAPGLAYNESGDQQSASIWTMAPDGTDARLVVDSAPGQAWVPAWSPDGASIAYTSSPSGNTAASVPGAAAEPEPNQAPGSVGPPPLTHGEQIWIVGADGSNPTQLTDDPGNNEGAAWSPDGRRLAFASDRTGGSHLWVMNADGTGQSQLTDGPGADWLPSWSPDGSRIAFTSDRDGDFEIWTMAADGSGLAQLTNDPAGDWAPVWSPDGSRITFTSDRGGPADIWSMEAGDGSDPLNLTDSPERVDGEWSNSWSPDGGQLAYASAAVLPEVDTPLVTEDLAVAGTLLFAVLLGLVALVLVRFEAPFGSFSVVLVMNVGFAAFVSDQWRFLPATIVFGLLLDAAVWISGVRWRSWVAAAGLPLALALSVGLTLAVTGELAWSPTLFIGVALACMLIGAGLAFGAGLGRPASGASAPP